MIEPYRKLFYLGGMIACMTMSQVFLKMASNYVNDNTGLIASYLVNPWLWSGLTTSALGLAFWIMTLRHMPLALAYPWTALVYVSTPVASVLFFGDVLDTKYIVCMAGIICGVMLATGGIKLK